ncbi:phage terminase large subunit, partial [Candidatus Parcubacteria bacterium]|nr:phage terminase large subunit [Candidatus Parcubacteria bacterium]
MIREFDNFRIFLLEGGRGGSKSHSIGRFLLYLGEKYNLRIACGRETQNSIAESVHQLLSDLINEYQLDYVVEVSAIRHRKKNTVFTFIGLLERGRFNIQGIEGVDILWIEEGQAIAKPTMDTILPTIRKTNSKIIISMNRHVVNDPAYHMTVGRPDCLHLPISYLENEHCTQELLKEAAICKVQSERDYKHIWLGEPLEQGDDALFSTKDFELGKANSHTLSPGYGHRVAGFDIARMGDDKCAVVILQQMGALHWEEIFSDEWGKMDLNWTTGRILDICNEYKVDMAAIDVDGLGSGPFDTLNKGRNLDYFVPFRNPPYSYERNKYFCNERTVNAYKFKDAVSKGHRHIKTPAII